MIALIVIGGVALFLFCALGIYFYISKVGVMPDQGDLSGTERSEESEDTLITYDVLGTMEKANKVTYSVELASMDDTDTYDYVAPRDGTYGIILSEANDQVVGINIKDDNNNTLLDTGSKEPNRVVMSADSTYHCQLINNSNNSVTITITIIEQKETYDIKMAQFSDVGDFKFIIIPVDE